MSQKKERESLAGCLVFYTMYKREEKRGGGGGNDRAESPAGSHARSIVKSECRKYERRTVDWLVKTMPERDQRVTVKSSLRVNGEIDLGSP